jgi:hypothetical protein
MTKIDDGYYKQCLLIRRLYDTGRTIVEISWIPEKFAILNKVLRIEDEDGWIVRDVYGSSLLKNILRTQSSSRHHREVTDI